MQLGVHSEIGKLRKVMVSRPSLAHQRLTPGNCHDLLFDDVIWVQKARADHADFVLRMKDRDIEVYDIQDLLTEVFRDSPEARGRCWRASCARGSTSSIRVSSPGTCSAAWSWRTCPRT
jgi:arginine deiminase